MWCHEFLAPSYAANVGIMNFFGIVSSRILLVKGENVSIIGLILSLAPSSISNCSFIFSNYWSTLTSSFLHLFSLWYWFLPYFSPLPLFQAHMRNFPWHHFLCGLILPCFEVVPLVLSLSWSLHFLHQHLCYSAMDSIVHDGLKFTVAEPNQRA